MTPNRRTRWILAVTLIALAVYDLFAKLIWGGIATLSTAVGYWLGSYWFFCILLGAVFGHLVAMMEKGTPQEPWRWLLVFLSFAISATLTKLLG
jgi:hypothetical protein